MTSKTSCKVNPRTGRFSHTYDIFIVRHKKLHYVVTKIIYLCHLHFSSLQKNVFATIIPTSYVSYIKDLSMSWFGTKSIVTIISRVTHV
jgi:hypothetical protein